MAGAAANGMTRITLSFLLSLLSDNNLGPNGPSKHHWSYKGPEGPQNWPVHYKGCAGLKQSPIDIETRQTVFNPSLGKFHLDNFHTYSETNGPTMLNVTNNGHAASVRVTSDMRVSGGGLNGTYKTAEFHFHWGSTDDVGSEHALDGRKFPLEMHIVNYAEKYGTIKDAMTEPDGLAVLGVFFELSDTDNLEFSGLENALSYVQKAGEHNLVQRVRLRSLLPDDISRYWRYSGSLTTPMCFESVTWTVFATPQKISRSQLDTLRSLLHENGHDKATHLRADISTPSRLVDNWRPVQPLNGRTVYRSFEDPYYALDTRHSSNINNAIVVKPRVKPIVPSPQPSSQQISINLNANLASAKQYTASLVPTSIPFISKSKLKIDPTLIPGTNSVASFATPTAVTRNKSYKDSFVDFTRTQYQTDMKTDSDLQIKPGQNKNLDTILELQKQQKLIEMQTQQQLQRLMELRQQQQRLNEQLESQQLGSISLLPNVQTLDAQNQPGPFAIQGEGGRSLRNGGMILNDDAGRGDQGNAWINPSYQNRLPSQPQKQTLSSFPASSPSAQPQQRYVKPIDPSILLNFRQDGFSLQNQQALLSRAQQLPQQQTMLKKESPTPSYNLNSQYQNQPKMQGRQQSDVNKSLFSHLRNPQGLRQNPSSTGYQQVYRNYPKQQPTAQRQGGISRQQQQQSSSSKLNPVQLRSLLEKLTSNTRQQDGPQTLMSPAARMLPPIGDVNSISRSGNAAANRGSLHPRNIVRLPDTRFKSQSGNRVPPTLTSGMNPIPSNQRLQRVTGQLPPQQPTRMNPSASPGTSSSKSPPSRPSPSTSYNFGNQQTYQFNRNRQTPSYNRQAAANTNWYYTDMNGGQQQQEELPYVFLHHIQKPVRIRRPFYERLYNI